MGAFLSSVRLDFSHIFLLEMKKDQLGVLPNRSYHHIQRANCNFSSGIVALARYFQLFLSVNIKRITQTLYQYLRDWMANPVDYDTTAFMHPIEKSGCILHPFLRIGSPAHDNNSIILIAGRKRKKSIARKHLRTVFPVQGVLPDILGETIKLIQ